MPTYAHTRRIRCPDGTRPWVDPSSYIPTQQEEKNAWQAVGGWNYTREFDEPAQSLYPDPHERVHRMMSPAAPQKLLIPVGNPERPDEELPCMHWADNAHQPRTLLGSGRPGDLGGLHGALKPWYITYKYIYYQYYYVEKADSVKGVPGGYDQSVLIPTSAPKGFNFEHPHNRPLVDRDFNGVDDSYQDKNVNGFVDEMELNFMDSAHDDNPQHWKPALFDGSLPWFHLRDLNRPYGDFDRDGIPNWIDQDHPEGDHDGDGIMNTDDQDNPFFHRVYTR